MPHLRMEYSLNLPIEEKDFSPLFIKMHHILVKHANANLSRCQSRAFASSNFLVGDGDPKRAFISLHIFLLEGRTSQELQNSGKELLKAICEHFQKPIASHKTQISVQISQIPHNPSHESTSYFYQEM
ncbi:MAG: hypothetical protein FJZ56_05740 [Chlamydiae bacterium]|nr:hypothetical protein [Chlamydiota bacterium]